MTFLLSLCLAASTAWTLLGLFAVLRVVRRRPGVEGGDEAHLDSVRVHSTSPCKAGPSTIVSPTRQRSRVPGG